MIFQTHYIGFTFELKSLLCCYFSTLTVHVMFGWLVLNEIQLFGGNNMPRLSVSKDRKAIIQSSMYKDMSCYSLL